LRAAGGLRRSGTYQNRERNAAGKSWQQTNLVLCPEDGSMYSADALNWRFGKMTRKAGIGHWHAHEGRHTAVSIMKQQRRPDPRHRRHGGPQVHPRHRERLPARHLARDQGGATIMNSVFDDDVNE
jgi:hypothetical protein